MDSEFFFYQAASSLPAGFSLADYKQEFYSSSSPLRAEITNPQNNQILKFDSADGKWKNVNP
jgi:hypothetical protein